MEEQEEVRRGSFGADRSKSDIAEGNAQSSSRGADNAYELEAAKEYAEMIVNTIREAMLVLDLDLRVKSANQSFYEMFETSPEETEGFLVYELGNGQWDIPELRELLTDILPERKEFNDFEVDHEFEDLGRRVMLLNARQINHHEMILLAIEDATEVRVHQRRLLESQERFDLLVENAKEYAIFMMDEETTITMWNPGAERILRWTEEEIVGETGDIIFTEEDREAGVPEKELEGAREMGSALDDRWHVRKDGSRFWATGFMVALRGDDGVRGFAKILRDDTKHKEAEDERRALIEALKEEQYELNRLNETLEERVAARTEQVRELASTLTRAEQQERQRISRILHDDLQQWLYGIQLKLTLLQKRIDARDVEPLRRDLLEAEEWVNLAIETTRGLTVDLNPPLLQGEGLREALQWLVAQMQRMHGLVVELNAEHAVVIADHDVRVLVFQIVRELLFNVVKHAGVNKASVELMRADGQAVVRVADEGAGFDVQEAETVDDEGGFGLFSARERLNLFGGRMEIDSAPGEGTVVMIYAPYRLGRRNRPDDDANRAAAE